MGARPRFLNTQHRRDLIARRQAYARADSNINVYVVGVDKSHPSTRLHTQPAISQTNDSEYCAGEASATTNAAKNFTLRARRQKAAAYCVPARNCPSRRNNRHHTPNCCSISKAAAHCELVTPHDIFNTNTNLCGVISERECYTGRGASETLR